MDVFLSPNRSLAYIIAEDKSDAYVKAIMSILIADTADFLNVGKTISGPQIMQTIELMLEDFSVYKVDFFKACFDKAKKGFYGKQYDRLDGQIIFEWLAEYEYEYQTEIERNRATEKTLIEKGKISLATDQTDKKVIGEPNGVPMPDYIKDMINTIATKKVLPVKERVKTAAELVFDGFIEDFDMIFEKYGNPGGIKTISIYGVPGKSMSIQEYIECRTLAHENGMSDPFLSECIEDCVEVLKKFHQERARKVRERQNAKNWKK